MRSACARLPLAVLVALWSLGPAGAQPVPLASDEVGKAVVAHVPARVDALLDTLLPAFDERAAMDIVTFMDRYWRVAGNAGFEASQQMIHDRLVAACFAPNAPSGGSSPRVAFEQFENAGKGWDYTEGTLTLVGRDGEPDEVLLSRDRHRVALCINSFSTHAEIGRAHV